MTKDYTSGLSDRQKQALPIFACAHDITAACERVGISRDCYYEWKRQPEFKSALEEIRDELFQEAISSLKSAADKATSTLISLAVDTTTPPATRKAAASDILSLLIRWKETQEIEKRICIIEDQIKR